jgi:uncharacterized damage-inducible protein DinB
VTGDLPTPELAQWAQTWEQTRRLTYDLLHTLPYPVMNFSPHPEFGTLIRQMRHAADMQARYIAAIRSGRMEIRGQSRQRALEQSKENLEAYMRYLDSDLLEVLRGLTPDQLARRIEWGTTTPTLLQHLMRLLQHEALHHGMWAFYAKIADLPLPPSWQEAWELV